MNTCSVHKYKYSQDSRRNILKRMCKAGFLKKIEESKTHKYYQILDMDEYVKRTKKSP